VSSPEPVPKFDGSTLFRSANMGKPEKGRVVVIVTPYRVPDVGVKRNTVACATSATAAAEPIPNEGAFS